MRAPGFLGGLCAAIVVSGCGTRGPAAPTRPVSYLALRYEATVPQGFDYTCGAASVATILSYYWGRPTTEAEVIGALRQRYSLAEIARRRETGLSFDDLIFAATRLGFAAQGARIRLAELPKLAGPVIVHLDKGRFQHFAVLRSVGKGVYYISDPVVGQIAMSAAEFGTQFSGNILAVWKDGADLPENAILSRPRDGVSALDTFGTLIDAPVTVPRPIL